MKKALVTVSIGEKYTAMSEVTHPTLKAYADRIGAEFIVISERKINKLVPYFEKLQMYELFGTYDRIIFMDSDIAVRPDCPDLFEEVPESKIGVFMEGEFIPRRKYDLEMAAKTYKMRILMDPETWKGEYFNSGVCVASKVHKDIFEPIDFEDVDPHGWDYGEQGLLNLRVLNSSTPIHKLDYKFNRMTVMDEFTGEDRHASYIIHYAGAPNEFTMPDGKILTLPEFIQRDIDTWAAAAPEYNFKRHLLITAGGGLGDQIDAEPVIRYIVEKAYPEADVRVISDFPRVFSHLVDDHGITVAKRKEMGVDYDTPYYKMETLPVPENIMWKTVAHTMCHSTDFSSMSCLRRILPTKDKEIKLKVYPEDLVKLLEVTGIRPLSEMVLVHPGRNWPSKTFPSEWWQAVIDGIHHAGIMVTLIGKDVSDEQGLVPVECREGMLDLRDKTTIGGLFALMSQARVCVTNDSCPEHIAGAFDRYIICIPSCKHPEHIMPFRKGTQTYKAASMYRKLTCDDIDSNPTQVHGQTIDWVKGGDIVPYLPNPKDVAKQAVEFYRLAEQEEKDLEAAQNEAVTA